MDTWKFIQAFYQEIVDTHIKCCIDLYPDWSVIQGVSLNWNPLSRDAPPWRSGCRQRRQRWFLVRQQTRPLLQSLLLLHCFLSHGPSTASSGNTGVQILSPTGLITAVC